VQKLQELMPLRVLLLPRLDAGGRETVSCRAPSNITLLGMPLSLRQSVSAASED